MPTSLRPHPPLLALVDRPDNESWAVRLIEQLTSSDRVSEVGTLQRISDITAQARVQRRFTMSATTAPNRSTRATKRAPVQCRRRRAHGVVFVLLLTISTLAVAAPSLANAQWLAHRVYEHTTTHHRLNTRPASVSSVATRSYDSLVLSQKPVMFLTMSHASSGIEADATGHGHSGTYLPSGKRPRSVLMPNGDAATLFDGRTQYLQVPDSTSLSVPKTGVLTVSAWIRPDVLQFPAQEGTGYVNYLGKGKYARTNQLEYELRMYSKVNTENTPRPNRLCAYCFNLPGGCGSGSYVQDPVTPGGWIMITEVINTRVTTSTAPTGYVTIFKNGVRRMTVALTQYNITPMHGTAPFRVGSVELASFFMGAIGKVAVFDYEVTPAQVAAEYAAMTK